MLKRKSANSFLFFITLCLAQIFFTENAFAKKQTLGLIEKALILPENLVVDAKLDTGADSCSLHADDIKEFEKEGKKFVKFTIVDRYGKKRTVIKEIVRHVRIKRLNNKSQIRKMINIGLCLGDVYKIAEVSLVDRGAFNYEMLIGRRYLSGDFIVDPAITYTVDPNCNIEKEEKSN
ncbi:MAG: ATP-dependent zinc protease [Bdellovibrionota bacterium]